MVTNTANAVADEPEWVHRIYRGISGNMRKQKHQTFTRDWEEVLASATVALHLCWAPRNDRTSLILGNELYQRVDQNDIVALFAAHSIYCVTTSILLVQQNQSVEVSL